MNSGPIANNAVTLDKLVALCKRRGLIYPACEIYGGLNGVYDVGPLGTLMMNNIKQTWLHSLDVSGYDIVQFDGALLGSPEVWKASGHVDNFSDPMVDCTVCKKRYRADEIDLNKACPHCGNKSWTAVRQFNMMFQTNLGAASDNASIAYLRPETAQSIFVNFKNVYTTTRVKIPFGIAQIGKAFRNEITPKQFLFRVREFEQMELEFFCKPDQTQHFFDTWCAIRKSFYDNIGLDSSRIRLRAHEQHELAHYSKQCNDVEYQFPFGWKELEGIADRGDFDLRQHSAHSGKDLSVFEQETQTSYIPHVVECSVGVGRLFLALLFDAYQEDTIDGETRIVLRLHPRIAPIKVAFLPLTGKQSIQTERLFKDMKKALNTAVVFDESGSIGKRYRRQDEIGTPLCVTYDFESDQDHCVTVRNRDTLKQERVSVQHLSAYLREMLQLA